MIVPEEYGGEGKDRVSFVLSLMEVSKSSVSVAALAAANHSFCCFPLMSYGNREQKKRYLQPCASGEKRGSYAPLEDDPNLEPLHITRRGEEERRGWLIQGVKHVVPYGSHASFCIVHAFEDQGGEAEGFSSFVVDLEGDAEPRIGRTEEGLNILARSRAEIIFENTPLHEDSLLGRRGEGLVHGASVQRECWLAIAALAVGIGRGAFEKTARLFRRKAGGRNDPSDQAAQWKFADMAVSLDAAELLTLRAAWLRDEGKPHDKETAMAKIFASNGAMTACTECLQIAGEWCPEPSLEDDLRKAKMCQVSMGTNEKAGVLVAKILSRGK